jgi:hypothetical protein
VYLGICFIAGKPTYAMKPTITGPQQRIVRKGKNLDLECKGLAEKGITFQVMWFKSNRQVCEFFIYSLLSLYFCHLSFL